LAPGRIKFFAGWRPGALLYRTPLIVHAIKFALDRWVTRAEISTKDLLYADGGSDVGLDRHKQIGPSGASSLKFFFFLRGRDGAVHDHAFEPEKQKSWEMGFWAPGGEWGRHE
jgi:hypothetical protein